MAPKTETTSLLEMEGVVGGTTIGGSFQQSSLPPIRILSNNKKEYPNTFWWRELKNARPSRELGVVSKNLVWALGGAVIGAALFLLLSSSSSSSSSSHIGGSMSLPLNEPAEEPSLSRYKKVQGLGFQIYTGGAPAFLDTDGDNTTRPTRNPECIGLHSYGVVNFFDSADLECYVGYDDPIQDARERVKVMVTAVERAYALADNADNDTLKVFIAPEFFWRGGVSGAYVFRGDIDNAGGVNRTNQKDNDDAGEGEGEEEEECSAICEIFSSMEQLVAQERFENWLFLFGTVLASEVLPKNETNNDYLFYNFAPVYKGYDPDKTTKDGKQFLVPKRYVSTSDFLTPRRHFYDSRATTLMNITAEVREIIDDTNVNSTDRHDKTVINPTDMFQKRYNNEMWLAYKKELSDLGYTMIEHDWLLVDDIAFTIEICFDHDRHSALSVYLADIATGSTTRIPSSTDRGLEYVSIPKSQAQVSLVSSGGMQITEESLVLTHNGVIFLQDGLSNKTASRYKAKNDCGVTEMEIIGGSEALQRRAVLSSTDASFEYALVETYQKHPVYSDTNNDWKASVGGVFSTSRYEPLITVYEPIEIATRTVAT